MPAGPSGRPAPWAVMSSVRPDIPGLRRLSYVSSARHWSSGSDILFEDKT